MTTVTTMALAVPSTSISPRMGTAYCSTGSTTRAELARSSRLPEGALCRGRHGDWRRRDRGGLRRCFRFAFPRGGGTRPFVEDGVDLGAEDEEARDQVQDDEDPDHRRE